MTQIESQETVLVVPRSKIVTVAPKVFNHEVGPVRAAVVAHNRFMERNLAEGDETYKQVIPYVLIRHQDKYLLMQRTKMQTESRLHNLYSLGIGGHINDADVADAHGDLLTAGMRREFNEEIRLESEDSCALVGVINDDSTPVARVHLGFVYLLVTSSPLYTIMESEKYTAEWHSATELANYYPQMESWAQIVHDHVIKGRI